MLSRLPEGHPSALGSENDRSDRLTSEADAASDGTSDVRPLTDAEFESRKAYVSEKLEEARSEGRETFLTHTTDPRHKIWNEDRSTVHTDIIKTLMKDASSVPRDGRAVLAGGLPGAGKTTTLDSLEGLDRSQYLKISPDDIKEELAERGLIPEVAGLTPMEASELVHAESSHVARQLAIAAMKEKVNVIWDVAMSTRDSTEERINHLRESNYSEIMGIFIDVAPEVSERRAEARYRQGHDDFRNNSGLGGRFLPEDVILSQADPTWGSANRHAFEQVKPILTDWVLLDNSIDGESATIIDSSGRAKEKDDKRY